MAFGLWKQKINQAKYDEQKTAEDNAVAPALVGNADEVDERSQHQVQTG
jgi:hypothetical protein